MLYAYTARSHDGRDASGTLTADSPQHAQKQLRGQGLFPVAIKPAIGTSRGLLRVPRWGSKVPIRDLMTFTTQLAVMARAGMDLAGSIQTVAKQCTNATLKLALEKVHDGVTAGLKVSMALANESQVFGEAYVASVAAGEASGKLPDVLGRLAQLQRGELRLRSTLRTLLSYPILLATSCTLVTFALMFFVLPKFAKVFADLGVPLPIMTQCMLAVAAELRTHWWIWTPLATCVTAAAGVWRTRPSGRVFCDRLMLHLPKLRDVTRSLFIGRAFRLLGTMLDSGVPLLDALRLTQSTFRNSLFRSLFDSLRNEVMNGRSMGARLADTPFVPPSAAQMVLTAERTGTLGSVMQLMGEFYEDEAETRLRELATILEPLIIVVMGAVVAFVVTSLMLPLFDFSTLNQHAS